MSALRYTLAIIHARIRSDRGANLVEYALLLVLIALVAIGAVAALGTGTSSHYSEITSNLG